MKKIIISFITVSVILFLSTGYYFIKFYNNIYIVNDILEHDSKLYKYHPDRFKKLVTIFEGKSGIIRFVSDKVLFNIGFKDEKNIPWQIKKSIMMIYLFAYYSDDQIFALWCHFISFENRQSIYDAAKSLFEKDLNQLTVNEMAQLVVFSRSPKLKETDSEKFNKIVNALLSKYGEHL